MKKKIDESKLLQNANLWVTPIVVFSNPKVELEVIDPEAEVVRLDELAEAINSFNNGYDFSNEQLKTIGNKIIENSLPT